MDNYHRNKEYSRVLRRRRRVRYLLIFGYQYKGLTREGTGSAVRDPYEVSLSFVSNKKVDHFDVGRSDKKESLAILKVSDKVSSPQALTEGFANFQLKQQIPESLLLLTVNIDANSLGIFRELLLSNSFYFKSKLLKLKLAVNPSLLEEKHFDDVKVIHDYAEKSLAVPTILLIELSNNYIKLDHAVSERFQKFLPMKKIPEFELKMKKFSFSSYFDEKYGSLMRTTYHDVDYRVDYEKHVNWFVRYFAANENLFEIFEGAKQHSLLPYSAYYQIETIRSSPVFIKISNWQSLTRNRENLKLFFRKYENVCLEVDQLKDAEFHLKYRLLLSKYQNLSEILTVYMLLNRRSIFCCFNDIQFLTKRTVEQIKLFAHFKYLSEVDVKIDQLYNHVDAFSPTVADI